jgi:hypothetical protein
VCPKKGRSAHFPVFGRRQGTNIDDRFMSGDGKSGSRADLRSLADERFQEALTETGARDPRDFYRERLRALRERNPDGYQRAVHYFEHELVPSVARTESDPVAEWLEYGCLLASLWVDGSAVQIDTSGRSMPYHRPIPSDALVLHLPTSPREPALAIGLPPSLSPAQHATYQLLVLRRAG